jgi:C1A family cysteine protease
MGKSTSFYTTAGAAFLVVSLAQAANHRGGGLLPDDPRLVRRVPTIMSLREYSRGQSKKSEILGASRTSSVRGGKRDGIAPSVTILNPVNGASVSSQVTIQATASDNVGVKSVTLSVDGTLVSSLTAGPYDFSWNADAVSIGNHIVSVMAIDAAGNSATSSITIAVNAPAIDVTATSVNIITPTNGATLSGVASVQVSASDNVGVASVELLLDDKSMGSLSAAPYTFSIDTATVANGTHTLSARAMDAAGNSSTSTITVAVNTTIVPITPTSLPTSYELVTPPVGDQGNEGACVPFATGYAARSIEQYYRTNANSYSYATNIFSPEYLYAQIKVGDCGSGSSISAALDYMYAKGITTWQTVPFNGDNGCTLTPSASQLAEAANYKITNYSKILHTDLTAIKAMLVQNHPVIIGANVDNNFVNAKPGYVWNTVTTGNVPHGLILMGYDESKNAFKIMNSWGTGWGDAGFIWVDYAVFLERVGYYVYVMNY